MWHLDWQQRTSKLLTASVPTLCQAVALIKGGPIDAHFYAICGISFFRHELIIVTEKTFRKYTTLLRDPKFCRKHHGKVSTVGTQLLFGSNIVGDFRFLMQHNFVSRSKSFRLFYSFFFDHDFHLEQRSHMLLLQRCTITYTAMEKMTSLIRASGCDARTHTHSLSLTHTQRACNVNAPERMKDRVGCFSSSCIQVDQPHCFCYGEGSGTYHAIELKTESQASWSDPSAGDM